MKDQKINSEYMKLTSEMVLLAKLQLRQFFRKNEESDSNAVLIVNTCLIGEFVSSVPAMRDFIERHPGVPVDLIVSPALKTLAERIIGVRHVYQARSVYARKGQEDADFTKAEVLDAYAKIIVLRISPDAYRLLQTIPAAHIETSFWGFYRYSFHLVRSLIFRERPRQWREVNFSMLRGTPKAYALEELFSFPERLIQGVKEKHAHEGTSKIIFVHASSHWSMKCWKDERWVELFKKIHESGDFTFFFIGAKEDEAQYQRFSTALPFPVRSLIGALDLAELVVAFTLGDYFIGIDSGPANVSYITKLGTVTLFGPGPHMYLPEGKHNKILDRSNGRGLYQMFFAAKESHIGKISVDDVYEAFKSLLRY